MLKNEINFPKPPRKFACQIIKCQAVLLALVLALACVPRTRADSRTCSGQTINLPFTDVLGSHALQPAELLARTKTTDYVGTIGRLKIQMQLIEEPIMQTQNGETYQIG